MTEVVSDISGADLNVLTDVCAEMNSWVVNLKTATNCKSHKEVTKEKLMTHTKETLVKCLLEGYQTVFSHKNKFESSKACLEQLKSELIAAQRSVVKLQQQIIDTQAEQMNTMSNVVDTAVDRGIKSYSEIVSQTIVQSRNLSKEKLKKAVQEAVHEDDRAKNVVVFGLSEEKSEDLDGKIVELFEEIEEKPSFEAARIGMVSTEKNRPVKVSLRNCETVHRLLAKAKKLKATAAYRNVYISPDRSPEEREKHRELVAKMKQKASEDPEKHYFLLKGEIFYREKD